MITDLRPRLASEFFGTFFLLVTIVGSGIMGESLAAGNSAVALLGNSLATGTALFVLITLCGPLSGAHFNPAVTLLFALRRELPPRLAVGYVAMQAAGALTGVLAANVMFDLPVWSWSQHARSGLAQGFSELLATVGLLLTILLGLRHARERLPLLVACYIVAAYWFTASTAFANPAVTLARACTDTFAGIRPADVPLFVGAQMLGLLLVFALAGTRLLESRR